MSVSLSLAGSWLAASRSRSPSPRWPPPPDPSGSASPPSWCSPPWCRWRAWRSPSVPALDPTYQIAVAAPVSTARIVLLRSLAVVGAALPVMRRAVARAARLVGARVRVAAARPWRWPVPAWPSATVIHVGRAAAASPPCGWSGAGVGLLGAPADECRGVRPGFAAFRPGGQARVRRGWRRRRWPSCSSRRDRLRDREVSSVIPDRRRRARRQALPIRTPCSTV